MDNQGSISHNSNKGIFSPCHCIQTGSTAHSASYPMDTGDKAGRAWSWPLTSI